MRLSVLGMETSMSGFSMLQASSPPSARANRAPSPKGDGVFVPVSRSPLKASPWKIRGGGRPRCLSTITCYHIQHHTSNVLSFAFFYRTKKHSDGSECFFVSDDLFFNFSTLYKRDYSAFSSSIRSSSRVMRLCTTFLPWASSWR